MELTTTQRRIARGDALLLLLLVGAAVPYLVPALARFRALRPAELTRFLPVGLGGRAASPLLVWNAPAEPPAPPRPAAVAPPPAGAAPPAAPPARRRLSLAELGTPSGVEVEDEPGELHRFFRKLDATREGLAGAVTRISHFGDSPLTGDLISGEARSRLQGMFGSAGHGFVLAGRPWGWYGHLGVSLSAAGWAARSPLLTPGNGGIHGLSGVSFQSGSAEASSVAKLERETFTRLVVSYLAAPGGGTLLVSVDGGAAEEIATAGDVRRTAGWERRCPGGARSVALRPKGDGEVVVHGVVLEGDGPGVVYDALGANGASVHFLWLLDAAGWEDALAQRGSDLVILNYGTNESGYAGIPGPRYEREYGDVVSRVRRALPLASVLVMAPMDRGLRDESGQVVSYPSIPRIVASQRRVARENGCAFFDTFSAMGGEGTMARWYDAEPRLVTGDFTHTTKTGSDRVARLLVAALTRAYLAWRGDNEPPATPAPPPPEASPAPAAGEAPGLIP